MDQTTLAAIVGKEAIRELALLYCRGIDRKDYELVQSLYTADATDTHGDMHFGTVRDFMANLRSGLPHLRYTGHHICNHLISVDGDGDGDGDEGEGELYALAYHIRKSPEGGHIEWLIGVRYLDKYRKEAGRWRFSKRVVIYDWETTRPISAPSGAPDPEADVSYGFFKSPLFRRGSRD